MALQSEKWYNKCNQKDALALRQQPRAWTMLRRSTDMGIIPRTPGVYRITCLVNGKFYIGGTSNLRKRWNYHTRDLRVGVHSIANMQSDYDRYGLDGFSFTIVEHTDLSSVFDREQYWIDLLRPYDPSIGYNIGRDAKAAFAGRKHTDDARRRISEINKAIGRPITPEQRERMIAGIRKPETRAKMSDSARARGYPEEKRQHYLLIDPNGVEHLTNTLEAFCIEHGLSRGNLIEVAKGKRKQHKGWTCQYSALPN